MVTAGVVEDVVSGIVVVGALAERWGWEAGRRLGVGGTGELPPPRGFSMFSF